MIARPTAVTETSATLIDNIFANKVLVVMNLYADCWFRIY